MKLELTNGEQVHRLINATDICVRESLNKNYYTTFKYPRLEDDEDRYNAIVEGAEVRFPLSLPDNVKGQRFVIRAVDEVRNGKRIYKQVEAHHIGFQLSRYYLDQNVDFAANQPPINVLNMIANGTPFSFAIDPTLTNKDVFEFGERPKNEALADAIEIYGAEVSYDNYTINFASRVGTNNGVSIRYRKNLNGITRKSSDMERVTRLYGYGKNGLTIEGYSGHTVKYIDSVHYDADNPYEGSITFPEIETQAALYDAMQKYLREHELPAVSYDIDFVQLEKVDPSFTSEAIRGVGDTITVKDDVLGYHFEARVTDYERYPFEPKKARVTLANFRDYTLGDFLYKVSVAGQKAMKYTSENAVLKGIKYDDSITLVDGLGMTVSDDMDRIRVRLGQVGAGDYGMALYNKGGQRTLWLDADTGDARFKGGIEASNIYGSNIVTNAGSFPRVELTSENNVFRAAKSAGSYIEIEANPSTYNSAALKFVNGGTTAIHGLMGNNYYTGISGGDYDISTSMGNIRILAGTGYSVIINSLRPQNIDLSTANINGLLQSDVSGLVSRLMSIESSIASLSSRVSALESA